VCAQFIKASVLFFCRFVVMCCTTHITARLKRIHPLRNNAALPYGLGSEYNTSVSYGPYIRRLVDGRQTANDDRRAEGRK
jgi:hypothetical protein